MKTTRRRLHMVSPHLCKQCCEEGNTCSDDMRFKTRATFTHLQR